jgi:disease resistance protein RPS2
LNTTLKCLKLRNINSTTGIFSYQIPKGNFSKLEVLEVWECDNLRNILAPPMFRGLTSLTTLKLVNCKELEEVIAQDQEAQEGQENDKETLFPRLKELVLRDLPKMRRFCHMTNVLELPSLEEMKIANCPMLEAFSMGSNDSDTKFLFNKEVCPSILSFVM